MTRFYIWRRGWDGKGNLRCSFKWALFLVVAYIVVMPGGSSEAGTSESAASSSGVSTPVAVEVGGLQPFQVKGDPHSISQRWRKWKRAFQLYVLGKGITNDSQKRGLLLHTAGLEVQEVFFTLVSDGEEKDYAATLKVLDDYFIPKANVPFERHVFRQIGQSSEETVDQFVCRLRQRAASCDFGEREDEYIRDQLIDKCYSAKLRRKFLEKQGSVTLNDLLVIARAQEAVDLQMETMGGNAGSEHVNSVTDVKFGANSEKKECFNCGREDHFARDWRCPARGRKCDQCGAVGHFKVKCHKRPQRGSQQGQKQGVSSWGRRVDPRVTDGGKKTNTNFVDSCTDGEAEKGERPNFTPEYVFSVGNEVNHCNGIVTLQIGGVILPNVLIDSGATCNLLGKETWEWLKNQRILCQTRKEAKVLFAYGNTTPLPTLGTFTADVTSGDTNVTCEADFVVMDGDGRTLLCRDTAEKLHLLRIGPIHTVNSVGVEAMGQDIKDKYKELFSGVGLLKGYELKLNIDDSVKPVAQPVRRIPFAVREKVERKLDELLESGIIEEVPEGPTGWVSPLVVVPKPDGDVRICVDMRRANQAIIRERQPIPTVEEVLQDLNGSRVFSRMDLKWGFHQILLAEESRHVTTFVTHRGLYRYTRLMFGVTSAPEKYQQIIRDVLRGCDGVVNIADDLVIHGKDLKQHDERLFTVLDRLKTAGLTLNESKCEFRLQRLTFFGHEVTQNGVKPSEEKVAAILHADPPQNASEARSFLGLVQFVSKFVPDLSSVAEPIQRLTHKNVEFKWYPEQQAAFEKLKELITNANALAYFSVDGRTRIVADASPVGLGAVLTQLQGSEWRVIAYASRRLTDVERRYSQTEKEALALVWACERFNMYVFGREFELETDHKPLEYIYSPKSKPSARVERWVLRLQAYDFRVVYRPGRTNIADALSRLNCKFRGDYGERYDYVCAVAENSVPCSLMSAEIEEASAEDPELNHIKECVRTGDWSRCTVPAYLQVKNELCTFGQLLLRGSRLVIPQVLRERVLELAHEGHQGIVKMKCRLRSKVWWPKIDADAEKLCKSCHGCQAVSEYVAPEPMARAFPPSGPWQDCAADILGPLPSGENLLVVVDYYSRYFEVVILKSTTSAKIIDSLKPIFSRFGVPYTLKTDNGPQFVSDEFEAYLAENGIEHRKAPPLWPQANGEVERQNRTLLKVIRIAQIDGKDWRQELQTFLIAYRSTPQMTTGVTPYYLLFGREMRTKLPDLRREAPITSEEVRDRDWAHKLSQKEYVDARRHAAESQVETGDKVLLRNTKTNKLSPNYDPSPCEVLDRNGGEVTVRNKDGVEIKRNVSFVKKYHEKLSENVNTGRREEKDMVETGEIVGQREPLEPTCLTAPVQSIVSPIPVQQVTTPRPTRTIRLPKRFDDYELQKG